MLHLRIGVLLLAALILAPPAVAQKTPITVTASSRIVLDLAATTGNVSLTPIRGQLLDNGDLPIASTSVTIRVDGATIATPTTGPDGRFSAAYRFSTLDRSYQVAAEYAGTAETQGSSVQKSILTVAAQFSIVDNINTTRGARPTLGGQILLNGNPYACASTSLPACVNVFVDSRPFGPFRTGTDGRFSFTPIIADSTGPGVHFVNYTGTVRVGGGGRPTTDVTITFQQLLYVRTPGSLVLLATLPAEWPTGKSLAPQVALRDGSAQPIGGVPVDLAIEGPKGTTTRRVATGTDGRAVFAILPEDAGRYNLSVSVSNPYVSGVANLTRSFRAGELLVDWLAGTPEIRKGERNDTDFVVTFGGERWGKWRPTAEGAAGSAVQAGTAWRVPLSAAKADDVGLRTLRLTFADVGVTEDLNWKVVSRPTLSVDHTSILSSGTSEVVFSVVDEAGKPVSGVPLAASLTSATAPWSRNSTGVTDTAGKWSWTFSATDVPLGPLTLNATGTGVFLQTQASQFQVQATPVSPAWSWTPWLIGAALLAAAAGGGYMVLRRRAAKPQAVAPETAGAVLAAHGRSPSLAIELSGVEPDLPPVWGAGEPFAILVKASGIGEEGEKPLAGAKLALRIEGSTDYPHEVALGDNGSGLVANLSGPEGECKVHVVYERDDRFDRTELVFTIRLVDYRREIAREFDAFVERATLAVPRLGRSSTPREVQWALEEKLSSDAASALEDVAAVVEQANYSTSPTGRADWLRLVRARQALDAHMPAGRGEPAG